MSHGAIGYSSDEQLEWRNRIPNVEKLCAAMFDCCLCSERERWH